VKCQKEIQHSRVLKEGSTEIGNGLWELVTATDGTQTRTILGGAVSIDVIVSLVSEMENKYSGTLAVERLNTR